MEDLLQEYKVALKGVRMMMGNASDEDKKLLGSMASDLQYAIEWMKTGRRPGNVRGIERRAAYQRERPYDPTFLQRYFRSMDDNVYEWDNHIQEDTLSTGDKEMLEDALSVLTDREKEIYIMSRGHSLSFARIAELLEVSKSTVQETIERAEKKITQKINYSLFCVS